MAEWTLYLWILKTVKHLISIDYYLIFQKKQISKEVINMLLYQMLAYTILAKNIKKSYENNKFKTSAPTWNENFELPDESYSLSDIQDSFKYISKKHGKKTDNLSIRINVNKTENRITFKVETGYYLELLSLKQWNYLEAKKVR